MLGLGTYIRKFRTPVQAELALMKHYAQRQRERRGWERRYAHMQFVLRWAPVFRRHVPAAERRLMPPQAA
ncbi:MAG TPA: hypothetical protein VMU17_02695 [Elusimicrobiota bacterium]|nr:hypothetical protein [Elusimicrobiota bacterium]